MHLISTDERSRQPFGLPSVAAWLREAGFDVDRLDLSGQQLEPSTVLAADVMALHPAMHTATWLATAGSAHIAARGADTRLCFVGLYGRVSASSLPGGALLPDDSTSTPVIEPFDAARLVYPRQHPGPELDALQRGLEAVVAEGARSGWTRGEVFDRLRALVGGSPSTARPRGEERAVAQFREPWVCCSEPLCELVTGWGIAEGKCTT